MWSRIVFFIVSTVTCVVTMMTSEENSRRSKAELGNARRILVGKTEGDRPHVRHGDWIGG
jgi:hypothetical protein